MPDRQTLLKFAPPVVLVMALLRIRVQILSAPLPLNDFIFYWSGARLFFTHADPYSLSSMSSIEWGLGWHHPPVALLYPPWVLPLIGGFALLPFAVIHALWRLMFIATEVGCGFALWRYFGGSAKSRWLSLAVLATFMPASSAEQMGQITCLVLAGITLFLLLVRKGQFAWAGASLLLLCLKPQLTLLVLVAVFLWSVRERRWTLLAGGTAAFAASSMAAITYNPRVLGYFHSAQPELGYSCGVGGVLRDAFGMEHSWLQFLPTALGLLWLAARWTRHKQCWDWSEQMPTLLLASLASAPYAWAHDYVLALPAVIALAVHLHRTANDFIMPAAGYLFLQLFIFAYLQNSQKGWQSVASTLWLAFYAYFSSRRPWANPVDAPPPHEETRLVAASA